MLYFIGIKGTGMAALATMMYDLGYEVMGSDLEKHFFTEEELVKRNIPILPISKENIKDNYTVIIGNAFLEDFEEVVAARNNPSCKCYRYHEYLGELMKDYHTVSICGSHGKTTTTTMAKNVLSHFVKTGYLIGDGEGYLNKDTEWLCVESCEFRRHFLAYYPDYALITNIEIDHVDYFKDEQDYFEAYQSFIRNVSKAVFYYGDDKWCQKLDFGNLDHYSFGFNENDNFRAVILHEDSKGTDFDFYHDGVLIHNFHLPLVGRHQIIDAMAVLAFSYIQGFDLHEVENSFHLYHGPKRRYVVEDYGNSVFIDDYAHHPTEVKVTLEATRTRYPDKKIVAIFKPHRASRVLYFAKDFVNALSLADKVYLLDFTSIDDKQDGTDIDITYLSKMLECSVVLSEDREGAKELALNGEAIYVFMSSKDIYNMATMTKEFL